VINLSREPAELLLNALIEQDRNNTLIVLFRAIKEQYSVVEFGEDIFLELQKLSSHIQEKRTKAALIETLVEFECFNYDYKILDEYLTLISQIETSDDDTARCLGAFISMNIFKKDILIRLSQFTDKQRAIRILVKVGVSDWGAIPKDYQEFAQKVQNAIRISNRTFFISQFLFFVHPSYCSFSNILNFSVNYPTIESAINDWAWRTTISTEYIINSKIVTPQEAKVFEKLGQLMYEKVHLTPNDKAQLYLEFFNGKDPINVIFNLPN
jgi:uncharacterized protein (UPF0128 family)